MSEIILKNIPYTFNDPSLLRTEAFVGGQWVGGTGKRTFPVYDPEDNIEICQVADLDRNDAKVAIEAASKAFASYKNSLPRDRRWLMRRWSDLVKANRDDLAAICTLELGKPYTESLVTVKYGTDFLDWFEGAAERQYGETIPAARGENRIFTIRQPQGVVVAITPWNSPIAMITRKVGAAIAAGNTVVCKPAPETPLCATALAVLFERAGGPPGVFNVITASADNAAEIGEEMCHNPLVQHLSFTGSTQVGRYLHTECAKTFKKTSMELGGNAPFIVFEDADIGKAAEGLISSKFRSSGQTCVCANRIFIHQSILEKFSATLSEKLESTFNYGSVWDKKVNFGPLYSPKALEKLESQLADATSNGAKIYHGGKEPNSRQNGEKTSVKNDGPNFYPPTVITGAKKDMLFMRQETFGPLAFLVPFSSDEEVIELANDTEAGLAGYFYTNDISRVWKVSEALNVGMVGVRVGLVSACEQPFGGIKESGMGREGGRAALDEYTEVKSVTVGI